MISFDRLIILGLGLIGGSIGLAIKKSGYTGTIVGFDIVKENIETALKARSIDLGAETLEDALRFSGLVIIAAPLESYEALFQQMAEVISDKWFVITDVGSVKEYVQCLAQKYFPKTVAFLGGHPMAGSEKSGLKAASEHLFDNAYYFLTPSETQDQESIVAVKEFVHCIGAFPIIVTPYEHDKIVAQISHVPHLLASVLVNSLNAGHTVFAGGGFRDTTRVASGNPYLWKDIFIHNKDEILTAIEILEISLADIKEIIKKGDGESLVSFLQKAKLIRDCLQQKD